MKRLLQQLLWSTGAMIVLEGFIHIEPKSEFVKTVNYVFYELVREVLR